MKKILSLFLLLSLVFNFFIVKAAPVTINLSSISLGTNTSYGIITNVTGGEITVVKYLSYSNQGNVGNFFNSCTSLTDGGGVWTVSTVGGDLFTKINDRPTYILLIQALMGGATTGTLGFRNGTSMNTYYLGSSYNPNGGLNGWGGYLTYSRSDGLSKSYPDPAEKIFCEAKFPYLVNTTPTISSVTVPSYINQSNVSSTPFTINGITDADAGQTLTYSYSWDGTNWTTIGTESTPKNNTSYSFNLNTTSRPQGNNTLRVKVNDGFVDSSIITSVNIVKDTVSPTLTQVTAVATPTNDNTPNYTFSSTEAGSITYGGSCSSVTTSAVSGNNTITFSTLPEGVFSNCTIRVTDTAGNQSSVLNVASFVVDLTAPVSPNSVIINGGG